MPTQQKSSLTHSFETPPLPTFTQFLSFHLLIIPQHQPSSFFFFYCIRRAYIMLQYLFTTSYIYPWHSKFRGQGFDEKAPFSLYFVFKVNEHIFYNFIHKQMTSILSSVFLSFLFSSSSSFFLCKSLFQQFFFFFFGIPTKTNKFYFV